MHLHKIFDATVISILLNARESWSLNKSVEKIDGCYTIMLRRVKNINPQSHTSNRALYNGRQPISHAVRQRHLRLADHIIRENEPDTKLLFRNLKPPEEDVGQTKPCRPSLNKTMGWTRTKLRCWYKTENDGENTSCHYQVDDQSKKVSLSIGSNHWWMKRLRY